MELPIEFLNRYENENKIDQQEIDQELKTIHENKSQALDDQAQFERRRKMIAEVSIEPFEDAFERYIGDNDLLPVNYFELGVMKSKAVGRIHYHDLRVNKPAVAKMQKVFQMRSWSSTMSMTFTGKKKRASHSI